MEEEKKDVEVEEKSTEEDKSSESQDKVEEQKVPYSRFKEVNDTVKTLKEEIDSLKATKEKEGLSPEQEKELQAKQFLEKLVDERLADRQKRESEQEKRELEEFTKAVDEEILLNPGVKKDDFLKFIEDNESKYGFQSVKSAMNIYRDFSKFKEPEKKDKKESKMPQNEGGNPQPKYDDSKKTLQEIKEEALREKGLV